MKNLLFPRVFHFIGWIIFIPAVIVGLLFFINGFCFVDLDIINWPSGFGETVMCDAIIIGIALGAVFIVCSKERKEDEMTNSIRLASLLNSLYVYVCLLVVTTLLINGLLFLSMMAIDMVLLPIIYVLIFRLEMHRYNKMSEEDEE